MTESPKKPKAAAKPRKAAAAKRETAPTATGAAKDAVRKPATPRKTTAKKSNVEPIDKPTLAKPAFTPTHDEIAELARKYWADRGYSHGAHEDDWFRAEQELRSKAS